MSAPVEEESPDARYRRYLHAVRDEPLPLALVDLDALERNVETVVAAARAQGKTVRVASKSLRSVDLIARVQGAGGSAVRGVMAYCAAEASFLATQGMGDLLIAYPTAHPADARRIAEANRSGAVVRAVADADVHLEALRVAAEAAGVIVPVVVDVDVSHRMLGGRVHIGVRRSPLHDVDDVVAFVRRVCETPGLSFAGLQAYEAHIAGLADDPARGLSAGAWFDSATKRAMKRLVRGSLATHRRALVDALTRAGIDVLLFNGGGTGSVGLTASEGPITEVAAGSGFLASHLFDRYRSITLEPAACFALQAVRKPMEGMVTCLGGGFVASGTAGQDRLPQPYLPAGLRLTPLEGAGEVQTPLLVPHGVDVPLGSPVFFRHAKAGELAEHFNEYLLVRGDRIVGRALTYRGSGRAFL